jgi:hypothetical protein
VKKLGLGDINLKAIEATASELNKQYPKLEIHTTQLDVASEQSIDDAIAYQHRSLALSIMR